MHYVLFIEGHKITVMDLWKAMFFFLCPHIIKVSLHGMKWSVKISYLTIFSPSIVCVNIYNIYQCRTCTHSQSLIRPRVAKVWAHGRNYQVIWCTTSSLWFLPLLWLTVAASTLLKPTISSSLIPLNNCGPHNTIEMSRWCPIEYNQRYVWIISLVWK